MGSALSVHRPDLAGSTNMAPGAGAVGTVKPHAGSQPGLQGKGVWLGSAGGKGAWSGPSPAPWEGGMAQSQPGPALRGEGVWLSPNRDGGGVP